MAYIYTKQFSVDPKKTAETIAEKIASMDSKAESVEEDKEFKKDNRKNKGHRYFILDKDGNILSKVTGEITDSDNIHFEVVIKVNGRDYGASATIWHNQIKDKEFYSKELDELIDRVKGLIGIRIK